jgi:coenzyme F420-0:L-glutamate ligase/coenzyme F420-1:gamma-L-glutamate ligase
MVSRLEVIPIEGIAEIGREDDLAGVMLDAIAAGGEELRTRDVLVVTHKVVSKAEGRVVEVVDEAAYRRLVEDEAASILRRRGDLVITKTRHGFVCANAGVDRSNTEAGTAVLLPIDPDRSAHGLRTRIERATGASIAVIITDTFGRAWRRGLVDVAIGVSGLPAILDLRGTVDGSGNVLEVTEVAIIDEIAAAADLVMGKADRIPAAIVRGLDLSGTGRATDLVRPLEEDLFR